ncbi:hypothetical protein SISNIDRAFT_422352 [Sistotremastrum niveocremeum HHB9708]|uniref:Matrin-type domain-containing protein n=1 Tax=Sistotremastrum niveocremeum HHB9708 TaxID=1314777 RepID=A0A165A4F1_9AGAM|nr:hypothetical protein SISNIDRAFT_422352 [Sistotremastrum niveocremeum HHB9708]
MSEFWVSKKKYWCTYCEIYITDDAPSRQHHENGLRHKGNKERFVRGLYKSGEKRRRDLEDEQRDLKGIDKAAAAAFAQDVAAGRASSSSGPSSSKSAAPISKPPPKPTSKFANYSTAESLGYVDVDAQRQAALAALRSKEGTVGAWEVVDASPVAKPQEDEVAPEAHVDVKPTVVTKSGTTESQEIIDDDDTHRFKIRRKTAHPGLGEIYDPGIIQVRKKTEPSEAVTPTDVSTIPQSSSSEHDPDATQRPKWNTTKWKRAGDEAASSPTPETSGPFKDAETKEIKSEEDPATPSPATTALPALTQEESTLPKIEAKHDDSVPTASSDAAGGLFRKRKIRPAAQVGGSGPRRF